MEMAAAQLGGHPVYLQPAELGIGTRESVEDVTRTLACYHAIIAARVFDHALARADGGGERGAGAQHAVGQRSSAAGARRPADHRAAARPHRRREDRLRRRGATTSRARSPKAARCSAPSSSSPAPTATASTARDIRQVDRSGRGGRRRRHRLHRRLGVDGRRATATTSRAAFAPYQVNEALMARAPNAPGSSTACPRTAARK